MRRRQAGYMFAVDFSIFSFAGSTTALNPAGRSTSCLESSHFHPGSSIASGSCSQPAATRSRVSSHVRNPLRGIGGLHVARADRDGHPERFLKRSAAQHSGQEPGDRRIARTGRPDNADLETRDPPLAAGPAASGFRPRPARRAQPVFGCRAHIHSAIPHLDDDNSHPHLHQLAADFLQKFRGCLRKQRSPGGHLHKKVPAQGIQKFIQAGQEYIHKRKDGLINRAPVGFSAFGIRVGQGHIQRSGCAGGFRGLHHLR